MKNVDVVIIGSGIAGIAAGRALSNHSGVSYAILEQTPHVAGLACSFDVAGFTFDHGIHGLYTKDPFIEDFVRRSIDYDDIKLDLRVVDLWNGRMIPHPIQSHLGWLPKTDVANCVTDYFSARIECIQQGAGDFRSWARSSLGHTIAEQFIVPYAEKFWATESTSLGVDWLGVRVRVPDSKELIQGAIQKVDQSVHYVRNVFYPTDGGFGRYGIGLSSGLPIMHNCKVVGICHANKSVMLSNGEVMRYRQIISTVPLPELCRLIVDCPESILQASIQLRATSLMLVSLGLNCPISEPFHWAYSFDRECPFARLSLPSVWAASNAPAGCSSVQAEVYFIEKVPDPHTTTMEVIDWIQRLGLIQDRSQVIEKDVRTLKYANVVFDLNRSKAIETINQFFDTQCIFRCGRYAKWDYSLVDDVIRSSTTLVDQILNDFY